MNKKSITTFGIVGLLLTFFTTSCTKEYNSSTTSYITNNTAHTIRLAPYLNGNFSPEDSHVLAAMETIKVFSDNVYGRTIDPCYGTLLQPFDSVVVTFDDSVRIPHIKFNIVYTGNHKVLFSSNRALSNAANWIKKIDIENKHRLSGSFTYTFVEQDYLDAKQ